jgi:AraC-like DNA-binding protein/quercetin dioxygenase-like cupin family protein
MGNVVAHPAVEDEEQHDRKGEHTVSQRVVGFEGPVPPELCGFVRAAQAGGFEVREYELWPGYTFPDHAHAFSGLVVILAGRFTAQFGDIPYHVEPGRAMVLPAEAPHRETVGLAGARCLLIEGDGPGRLGVDASPDRPRVVRDSALGSIATQLGAGLGRPTAGVSLAEAARDLDHRLTDLYRTADRPIPKWLRVSWLRAQQEPERWTVRALARSVGVAAETLSRTFARFFGTTPSECLRANRLERAAQLLLMTEEPISSIAFSSGFVDQSHLTNAFRGRFGVTPGQVRGGAMVV